MRYLSVLFILIGSLSRAEELAEPNTSVRALGMGNAYSAVVRDKDSIFYNPAGLARVQGVNLTLFNLRLGADGRDVYDIYNRAKDATNYADTLRAFYGKNLWLGGGARAALTAPGFGFAAYDSAEVAAHLSNPAFPNLNFRYTNDLGYALGLAVDIFPTVHVGVVGQRITRTGAKQPIGLTTLGTLSNQALLDQISNRGTGYSASAGLLLGVPTPTLPRVSIVWKNMGQTTFTHEAGLRAPPAIDNEIVVGGSLDIDLPLVTITPSFDYKHATNMNEVAQKKIHLGLEVDLPLFAVRGGLHQGYYTAGVGADIGLLRVDAATYGVELGEYPGQKEDRRYVIEATIELGFDFSFGFLKGSSGGKGSDGKGGGSFGSSGGGSRSRGLKQRR